MHSPLPSIMQLCAQKAGPNLFQFLIRCFPSTQCGWAGITISQQIFLTKEVDKHDGKMIVAHCTGYVCSENLQFFCSDVIAITSWAPDVFVFVNLVCPFSHRQSILTLIGFKFPYVRIYVQPESQSRGARLSHEKRERVWLHSIELLLIGPEFPGGNNLPLDKCLLYQVVTSASIADFQVSPA